MEKHPSERPCLFRRAAGPGAVGVPATLWLIVMTVITAGMLKMMLLVVEAAVAAAVVLAAAAVAAGVVVVSGLLYPGLQGCYYRVNPALHTLNLN